MALPPRDVALAMPLGPWLLPLPELVRAMALTSITTPSSAPGAELEVVRGRLVPGVVPPVVPAVFLPQEWLVAQGDRVPPWDRRRATTAVWPAARAQSTALPTGVCWVVYNTTIGDYNRWSPARLSCLPRVIRCIAHTQRQAAKLNRIHLQGTHANGAAHQIVTNSRKQCRIIALHCGGYKSSTRQAG
jgi:hypothetical protein